MKRNFTFSLEMENLQNRHSYFCFESSSVCPRLANQNQLQAPYVEKDNTNLRDKNTGIHS
jgi:hypothetical protein